MISQWQVGLLMVVGCASSPTDSGESLGWTSGGGKADGSGPTWSSEVGLADRMQQTILPYFHAHAQVGSFIGVDNVPIQYVALRHSNEVGALVISSGRTESYLKY